MNTKTMTSGRETVIALATGIAASMQDTRLGSAQAFAGRLSPKAAMAFAAAGIDAPERLLFMSKAEIAKLPGVGPAARREAEAYCARYLPAKP